MGRNKQKQKEYDKLRYERIKPKKKIQDKIRYERLKNNNENYLKDIAEKRRKERARNPYPHRESTRKWKLAHPEQVKMMGRDWWYRTKYGITLMQYNELLKKQNNACLLCGSNTAYQTKGRNLFVDHDHESGKIRGLLCSRCDTMLGHVEIIGIEKIVGYLSK